MGEMKPTNCIDNFKNCKSACCKYFVFNVGEMDEDLKNYYNMHERTKVIGKKVFIFNKCKHLQKDGKCGLFGKPERPKVCTESYTQKTKGLHCPDSCIYKS